MDSLLVSGVTYWLPANNDDVVLLINEAKKNGEIICLRGAAHSFPLIRTLQANATSKPYKYVMLSKMNAVKIDAKNASVFVQAGCHLGFDPFDPTDTSTLENSLLYQLNQVGLALPDLGGITHQTVGGFLSTSSSGGSTTFSFEDSLQSIDIVTCENGEATLKTFTKPVTDNPDDPFYGAGVATMGLFGVIVSATFNCVKQFYIAGQEATTTEENCEIDLFDNGIVGKPNLETFFKQTQYTRLMWWPQENVNKMVVWKAWQANLQDAENWAWEVQPGQPPATKLKPYQEVPYIMGSPLLATIGADLLYSAIGQWPNWLLNLLGDTLEYQTIKALVETNFYPKILPEILKIFVTEDTPAKPAQRFADVWYNGLPMDNQMSDKLMPVWFTELWIDISQSQNVMKDLHSFFNLGPQNTGSFSFEIYAAKANAFWLSPAYKTDVIRIDIFWFGNNKSGDPTPFYEKFWHLLSKYNYRPHWGKYLPDGASAQGVNYLKNNYPKWESWMKLRQQLDPYQVFVNDYWRGHLGIPNL